MKIEDIDKEMKEVQASTTAAQKAFQEEDYVTAAKVYKAAAAKLRKIYSEDHPDTIKCLLFAGDSFFYLDKFSEAADTYLELEFIVDKHEQAPVDRSVLYFKTAKALEKAKRFDAAQKAYSKAIACGEKTLSENHPLLTIINESFASFLRHVRKNPAAANTYEKRAEELRERNKDIHGLYENYLEPLKKRPESVRNANLHARADGRSTSESHKIVINKPTERKSISSKDLKKVAVAVVVFVVISLVVGLSLRQTSVQPDAKVEEKPYVPQPGYDRNLMSNGGFEVERGCVDTPDHPAGLTGWKKVRDRVCLQKAIGLIGPTDGVHFLRLEMFGQVDHEIHTTRGRTYTLLLDVSTPAPDENPVVVYSLDGKTWSPIKVPKANEWHTETIHFKGNGGPMTFSLRAGSETGTTQRFVDNVRLYQDATPQEGFY